jgi:hypothetical protein
VFTEVAAVEGIEQGIATSSAVAIFGLVAFSCNLPVSALASSIEFLITCVEFALSCVGVECGVHVGILLFDGLGTRCY